ncbi:MAG: hypothetical protein Q4D29_04780 [Lachnospiraceae bacterium]|nr:hypothetical protein [Lachnospiraceae bacterium]
MYSYDTWQWFMFFYIYCLIGWIWETAYVSAKSGRFENRGFMNGPFLPIYGSGAIVILFTTLPARDYPIMVFFLGMISATILELITGIVMERLFHVRYWDYSYRKIQYKGYICLVSSLAWGVFSCFMVYGFHKPIEKVVLSIPHQIGDVITMALTVINTADFATSFKTALELKNMLISAEDIKKQIAKLERRAEIMEVFAADSAEKAKEDLREHISDIADKILESKEEAQAELLRIKAERDEMIASLKNRLSENKAVSSLLKRNPYTVSTRHAAALSSYRKQFIDTVKEKVGHK